MLKQKVLVLLALATATGLALAGCASNTSEPVAPPTATDEAAAPEVTTLAVGVLPFADLAAFYYALEEGYFTDEGLLDVTAVMASSGPQQITSLVAGDIQVASSNYVSAIQAISKGLPLMLVRENDLGGVEGLYALPDSDIKSAKDLVGHTLAVNAIGNVQSLTAASLVDADGGDSSGITFVELPPPNMLAALEQGQVDAAWMSDPFATIGMATDGIVRFADAWSGPNDGLGPSGWAATTQFVTENPNTVAAFIRAMDRAIAAVVADPSIVGKMVPLFTQVSPEAAAGLAPINWVVKSDLNSQLGGWQKVMTKYGALETTIDLDAAIFPGQ